MSSLFVAYYRVSTDRQGRSGLGLEAQRAAVRGYLGQATSIAEFTEIEGGKRSDRPALEKALAAARVRQAPLVVAKVDRLTRSVAFLSRLLEAGVDVRFADLPMIEGATQIPSAANGRRCRAGFYMAMPDFPIDPELHIRGSAPRVLRRTTEAMAFIQQMTLSRFGRTWLVPLHSDFDRLNLGSK